jgi:hypothetical protein
VGIYAGLYLALGGEVMLPFGVGWSVFLIWACAHVGGYVATQALPSLVALRAGRPQSRARAERPIARPRCLLRAQQRPCADRAARCSPCQCPAFDEQAWGVSWQGGFLHACRQACRSFRCADSAEWHSWCTCGSFCATGAGRHRVRWGGLAMNTEPQVAESTAR